MLHLHGLASPQRRPPTKLHAFESLGRVPFFSFNSKQDSVANSNRQRRWRPQSRGTLQRDSSNGLRGSACLPSWFVHFRIVLLPLCVIPQQAEEVFTGTASSWQVALLVRVTTDRAIAPRAAARRASSILTRLVEGNRPHQRGKISSRQQARKQMTNREEVADIFQVQLYAQHVRGIYLLATVAC